MSHYPHIAQAIAEQHQAELIAAAAHDRLARLARQAARRRRTAQRLVNRFRRYATA